MEYIIDNVIHAEYVNSAGRTARSAANCYQSHLACLTDMVPERGQQAVSSPIAPNPMQHWNSASWTWCKISSESPEAVIAAVDGYSGACIAAVEQLIVKGQCA
ncbi:uncharacterized protein MEPE_06821 [Melanopsichium pennsylvanicum]|uniref:Uncharacterized protein n=1 Tax=Melanopsichium pennsylvanicum TaxID=63383 RepID=A0AAJ5C8K5_9BASI|nr:uncharacterized protein MEPE_06821 [Melanopsichium pennsylvanicum]